MEAQRKVTCFVTRGQGTEAELLVFWHARSGLQVPAGTVEDGESFDEAAAREAAEETGLQGLRLVSPLGRRVYDLPAGRAVLRHEIRPRSAPRPDAPPAPGAVARVGVAVAARQDGYARVVYEEADLDSPERPVVRRVEGWVPEPALLYRQERAFYHFAADGHTPDRWRTLENGVYDFHVFWVPLVPRPEVLVAPQQAWLVEHYAALMRSVEPAAP